MRTCPILDAEENVLFVFVADSGQVSDCSRQVAAFLTAQHSTELDDALERHVINFTHTHSPDGDTITLLPCRPFFLLPRWCRQQYCISANKKGQRSRRL